jgi:hypothetical protein
MRSAAVTTTGVSFFTMFVVVVIASNLGIEVQLIRKQCVNRIVTRTADTAEKLNARTRKSHLRTASNAATDQNRHTLLRKESRKCSVTASVCIHDLGRNDLTVLYRVDLKLLGMSEVLKNLSVFISYCNFHIVISISLFISIDFR